MRVIQLYYWERADNSLEIFAIVLLFAYLMNEREDSCTALYPARIRRGFVATKFSVHRKRYYLCEMFY